MITSTRLAGSVLTLLFANLVLGQEPPTKPPPVQEVPVIETIEKDSKSGELPEMPPAMESADPEVYTIVEEMPQFPGGQEALFKYLGKNIQYPEVERVAGIQGKVLISFVVVKDGMVRDIKVLRGVPGGSGLETEAIRVVGTMPKWIPGRQNGKPVAVRMHLPVSFRFSSTVQPPAKK